MAGLTIALAGLLGPGALMNSGIVLATLAMAAAPADALARIRGLAPWMAALLASAAVSMLFAVDPLCGAATWSSVLGLLVDRTGAQAVWCGVSGLLDIVRGLLALLATATLLTTERRRRWALSLCVSTVAGAAILGLYDYVRGVRYVGGYLFVRPFGNANQSGNFLVIGLAPAVALLVFSRRAPVRVAAAVAVSLTGFAVLLTQSRMAWVGALASAAAIVWSAWGIRIRTIVTLGALLALLLGFWFYANPKGIARGIEGRLEIWSPAVAVVKDHPWIGIGPRNFPYVDERRYGEFDPWRHKQAHNMYLTVAAEQGLVGLAAFLGLLGAVGVRLVRARGQLSTVFDHACWHSALGSFLALVIIGFGSMPYHSRTAVMFWAIIGIFCAQVAGRVLEGAQGLGAPAADARAMSSAARFAR